MLRGIIAGAKSETEFGYFLYEVLIASCALKVAMEILQWAL